MDHLALVGVRADRRRAVGVSFGLSVGIHVVVVVLLVTSFSRAGKRAPLVVERVRLVWVDPAPAAASPRGAPCGTATIAAPDVPVPPKPVAAPRPVPKPVRAKNPAERLARPASPPPVRAVEPAPVPPLVAPAAAPPAGVTEGPPGAVGAALGRAVDGVDGGRVGGTGKDVLRLGDVATAPVLVRRVVPEYPRRARLAGIEGEVVLEVVVDRSGRVTSDVRVVTAVPELARAAVAAVQRWRFKPARDRAGTAVAVLMEVPVRFVLSDTP